MRSGRARRGWQRAQRIALGLTLVLTGCRSRDRAGDGRLPGRSAQDASLVAEMNAPGQRAAFGETTIATACQHESYANASTGLIVEEAGLHEDVFSLRNRDAVTPTAYDLEQALRLEDLLRAQANVTGRSAKQAACMDAFAQHFGTLTDVLVEADKVQKELDLSAFKEAAKEAEEDDQAETPAHKSEPHEAQSQR